MSKSKKKPTDRILAATLSVALTTCLTPIYAFAEPEMPATTTTTDTTVQSETTTTATTTTSETATSNSESTTTSGETVLNPDNETTKTEINPIDGQLTEPELKEYIIQTKLPENLETAKKITFTVNNAEYTNGSKVRVGDEIHVRVENVENSENYYKIASIQCGSISLFEGELNEQETFDGTFTLTEEMLSANNSENIEISVELTQIYKVEFYFDADKGDAAPNPEDFTVQEIFDKDNPDVAIGKVAILEANEQTGLKGFTATPIRNDNVQYYVSKVFINGEEINADNGLEIDSSTKAVTYLNLNANENYTIQVIFEEEGYNITVSEAEGGKISQPEPKEQIKYHGEAEFIVTPDDGYYVSQIQVNGIDVDIESDTFEEGFSISKYQNGRFKVYGIETEITVTANFQKVSSNSVTDIDIESDGIIKQEENYYFLKQGAVLEFKTNKNGIILEDRENNVIAGASNSQTAVINSAVEIAYITLYYTDSKYGDVTPHTMDLTQTPIQVAYNREHNLSLTLEPENEIYGDDFKVNWKVEDLHDGLTIKSVYYWFEGQGEDGESAKQKLEDSAGNIPEYITITAEEHNRKGGATLVVQVIDSAEQPSTSSIPFNVNATPPSVDVSIDGETSEGAEAGYYRTSRTATITIYDREDTFDKEAVNFSVYHNGTEIDAAHHNDAVKVYWDESKSSDGIFTANITFEADGEYEWKFIRYTNKAGKYNEGIQTENGESIYHFTIDTKTPQVTIQIAENTWSDAIQNILDTITFGIFKKSETEVTITGNPEDSEIKEISWYKENLTENLNSIYETKEQLFNALNEKYANSEFMVYNGTFTIDANEKVVIYARVMDNAGNIAYVRSDGLIIDNKIPDKLTITTDEDETKAIQNRAVTFTVEANEDTANDTAFSGIKRVYYKVQKNGISIGGNEEGEHDLYTWTETEGKLVTEWTGSFTLNPWEVSEYNQDDLTVTVYVKDNSENIHSVSRNLNINVDELGTSVEFTEDEYNENRLVDNYFTHRTAVVEIQNDRSTSFNREKAEEAIKSAISATEITDSYGNKVENPEDLIAFSDWEISSENGKNHKVTVQFNYYGNYVWNNTVYENNAGNTVYLLGEDTAAGFRFTIDKINPTGDITVSQNIWNAVLETLTFGLFTPNEYEVSAEASDLTSPVQIEYYISHDTNLLDRSILETIDSWKFYYDSNQPDKPAEDGRPFKLENPDEYVVYLRITDYAGNVNYDISSDGHIIDEEAPIITLTPESPTTYIDDKPVYNMDYLNGISIDVSVTDPNHYSGLNFVEYWVESDGVRTQEGILYNFEDEKPFNAEHGNGKDDKPFYNTLQPNLNKTIIVDARKNNSCNVVVYVKAVDNAGNGNREENIVSVPLDIDITAPAISVSYDNNSDNNGNGYFDTVRTATVTITERTHHFDSATATDNIEITSVDVEGNPVENTFVISNWNTVQGDSPDNDTHTATISYSSDANYTFAISYTDKAYNENSEVNTGNSVAPYTFTVDTTPPEGTITAVSAEGRTETWNELLQSLNFGFWSNTNINISGTSSDKTSPIASVEYYKLSAVNADDGTEPLSVEELNGISAWESFNELSLTPNEQTTVYLRIRDMAGNTTYINTNGLIVDNNAPHEEFTAPEISLTSEKTDNGIYNGDVKIDVSVEDPLVGGTYSGLKTINYRVLNMGQETQSGTLYEFNSATPQQSELLKTWTGEITVDSNLNNSNNVVIEIYAVDNALNSSTETTSVKIDTTAPEIAVTYSNNQVSGAADKYYRSRTANFVITERNFDASDVVLYKIKDNVSTAVTLQWGETSGSGNGDNTQYSASLPFNDDGDYSFSISFTDMAGNESEKITGETFTVDATAPSISVSFDNNEVQNDVYFKENRTATLTVTEHNFDSDRSKVKITASLDGETIEVPVLSEWKDKGNDQHEATIAFTNDGDYTFSIESTDMAGNKNSNVDYGTTKAGEKFTVDTEIRKPEITGVEDGKPYKGEVIPSISFSDINVDSYEYSILRTSMNKKNIDVTEQFMPETSLIRDGNSFIGTYDTFESIRDNDGIYTLNVKIKDKAGNEEEQQVTFSVNRFGSVYVFSDYMISLQGAYKQTIDEPIVITEYNADPLVSDSLKIEIDCDNTPKQDVEYTSSPEVNSSVKAGESGWYEYSYTIESNNFQQDGGYEIKISSLDKAGNPSEATNDKNKKSILNYDGEFINGEAVSFKVDTTPPELTNVTGLEKKSIDASTVDVGYEVFDAIGLEKITVYVDNKEVFATDNFENLINTSGTFQLSEGVDQQVKFMIEDKAGNVTDTSDANFAHAFKFEPIVTISPNPFIRWYANKVLFWSSLGIGGAGIAGAIAAILKKRRHRN